VLREFGGQIFRILSLPELVGLQKKSTRIANGLSNREIAEKLFVSENTVKTHSSRLFHKLSARHRTQAVQLGKELGLIP